MSGETFASRTGGLSSLSSMRLCGCEYGEVFVCMLVYVYMYDVGVLLSMGVSE